MKKHIGYIERSFGFNDRKDVSGDMGWSFADMSDTHSEDIAELLKGSEAYCFGEPAVMDNDTMDEDGSFAIYSIYEADLELEDETDPLWSGTIVESTSKLLEVHVCATRERAGWIEDLEEYKGETIKYRNHEN